ncbi:MAG: hypothetical protein Q9M23_00660, partial [Mariprofundaceae bacterium]|nr:hypothetical protein [Mariprofundaceae bacterium]
MALIASWDGSSLKISNEHGEQQFVFESIYPPAGAPEGVLADRAAQQTNAEHEEPEDMTQEAVSALTLGSVDAPLAACLLPAEMLLQRDFSLPFEHPRFVDAATLAQELADQAGAEEDDWWLCWQAAPVASGVRGLVFALPERLREELSMAAISQPCPYIGPDIAVRLSSYIKQGVASTGVLDADSEGLMLGVLADGAWRGMRRLNFGTGRGLENLAQETLASLKAMGFDMNSMPLLGRIDSEWKQALDRLDGADLIDWQVEIAGMLDAEHEDASNGLPDRHAANALAMHKLILNDQQAAAPFNFRHAAWAVQTDWNKRIGPWRRTAVLLAALVLSLFTHDAWQAQRLQDRQESMRSAIEQAFHQALPGVAMSDPMLQLRQAAGGGGS